MLPLSVCGDICERVGVVYPSHDYRTTIPGEVFSKRLTMSWSSVLAICSECVFEASYDGLEFGFRNLEASYDGLAARR